MITELSWVMIGKWVQKPEIDIGLKQQGLTWGTRVGAATALLLGGYLFCLHKNNRWLYSMEYNAQKLENNTIGTAKIGVTLANGSWSNNR